MVIAMKLARFILMAMWNKLHNSILLFVGVVDFLCVVLRQSKVSHGLYLAFVLKFGIRKASAPTRLFFCSFTPEEIICPNTTENSM